LGAFLSDISDGSDTDFIYTQSRANVNNATTKNTLKQTQHQTKSLFVYKHTVGSRDYSCWDQSFLIPKNENALWEEVV